MFYFCTGNNTIAFFINMNMDDKFISNLHAFFLLSERAENIFCQSPVKECSVFIHPRAFKICEITYLCKWLFSCSDRSFVLVKIYETFYLVTRFSSFGHVFLWHKDFSFTTCVKIHSEYFSETFTASFFFYTKEIILSKSYFF